MANLRSLIGQSPLTDPRSLASSLLLHGLLLLVLSAVVLTAGGPQRRVLPHVLRGELEPVDNRVPPAKEGGGAPGALGGAGLVEYVPKALPGSSSGTPAYSTADAVISEVLPKPGAAESLERVLPGPQTSGVGVLAGPGSGGGGGSGGGSGGGVGRGVGPGTEFFGARERANSYTYVIDCSGSMDTRRSLDVAKRELLASLNQLPPDAKFAVVFYNLQATIFTDPQNQQGLMAATAANKERLRTLLGKVVADGGTDHMKALETAFRLRAEVIYFLTDADLMTPADVDKLLEQHGKTRIHAIQFGTGANLEGNDAPLATLAKATGGSYRYIDVTTFPER